MYLNAAPSSVVVTARRSTRPGSTFRSNTSSHSFARAIRRKHGSTSRPPRRAAAAAAPSAPPPAGSAILGSVHTE
eukprot:13178641-Heterocapsa_arctica.AAC.1